MFSTLRAVFRTGLPAFCSAVAQVFVAHHSPAEDRPFLGRRRNASVSEFLKKPLAFALGEPGMAPDLRRRHWLAVDGQVAVWFAFVGNAEQINPQAARRDTARLQRHVLAPVCRVELEGWALHAALRPLIACCARA